jgi:Mg2+-importing ATPase
VDKEWVDAQGLVVALGSDARGLSQREADTRLKQYGPNALEAKKTATAPGLFVNQFKNPLVLILIVVSTISLVAAEWIDAGLVLAIVFGSTILGFAQEYIAGNAIEKLRSKAPVRAGDDSRSRIRMRSLLVE